ncbi:MAG TPA: hypothetical protein VJ044_08480 [Candidatus Hodarchaeales archaeon]|nr:hypothetical protein [Candidatus Hodarchaeales archaeon]
MDSIRYLNTILTVIAVCLILIVIRVYFEPSLAHANPTQTDVWVTGGQIEISNTDELARDIARHIDGMTVVVE